MFKQGNENIRDRNMRRQSVIFDDIFVRDHLLRVLYSKFLLLINSGQSTIVNEEFIRYKQVRPI